jgi:hypothetical protein
MPSSGMQNAPHPNLGILQESNHLHVAIMWNVTNIVIRSPLP